MIQPLWKSSLDVQQHLVSLTNLLISGNQHLVSSYVICRISALCKAVYLVLAWTLWSTGQNDVMASQSNDSCQFRTFCAKKLGPQSQTRCKCSHLHPDTGSRLKNCHPVWGIGDDSEMIFQRLDLEVSQQFQCLPRAHEIRWMSPSSLVKRIDCTASCLAFM